MKRSLPVAVTTARFSSHKDEIVVALRYYFKRTRYDG